MIKNFLLGLFVLFVGFFSFVEASVYGHVVPVGSYISSQYNSEYKMLINGQGLFLTSFGLEGKQILMSNIGRYFFFLNDGSPYIGNSTHSDGRWHEEGVPLNFLMCDSFSSDDVSPSNCVNYIYSSYSGYVTYIFKNINNWYYGTFTEDSLGGWNGNLMCFSSDSIGKSICFYSCSHPNCGRTSDTIGGVSVINNLSNSQDFGFDFISIPVNRLGSYPGYEGGIINGSSQNVINSGITGNVTYSTCTNSKALSYYKIQGYNDKLCYSSYGNNTDIYSSPGSVSDYSLTGLDISEVWMDTAGYRRYGNTGSALSYNDWFQYWRKSFEVYNNSYNSSGTVSNPFVGVPVSLFTLFGNVYSYGLAYNNQSIIEYCDLLLFTNPNNPYEGILGDLPCNYSAIDILADTIGVHADSGEVVKGSSWEGILNRPGYHLDLGRNSGSVSSGNSSGLSYFGDGKSFINNSFNLLSDSFRFPDRDSRGIIPSYILVFMFALILFRFISH